MLHQSNQGMRIISELQTGNQPIAYIIGWVHMLINTRFIPRLKS